MVQSFFAKSTNVEYFFGQLWEQSLNPLWVAEVVEDDFIIIAANPAAQRVDAQQQPGASIRQLADKIGNPEGLLAGYFEALKVGRAVQFEQRASLKGKDFFYRTLLVPIKNDEGHITHIWGAAHNLTDFLDPHKELLAINKLLDEKVQQRTEQLNIAMAELQRLSVTDDLTALANRRCFDQALTEAVERTQSDQHGLSLIYLDIDHFKQFNDRWGHAEGDRCLCAVADVLARLASEYQALAARYGGEEFVVLLTGANASTTLTAAESIRAHVEGMQWKVAGQLQTVTVSLGVAIIEPSTQGLAKLSGDDLLKAADNALYDAKAAGRNGFQVAYL